MTTFTVTLPDSFTVHSRGVDYKFATDQLPAAMVAMGAIHGFTQKLADSLADKAKVEGREEEVIHAVWDAIVTGEWTRRRTAGPGMSELDAEIYSMARAAIQKALMSKLDIKAVKNLTKEHIATIDKLTPEFAAKKADEYRPIAEQTIAANKAKKAMTGDVDLAALGL